MNKLSEEMRLKITANRNAALQRLQVTKDKEAARVKSCNTRIFDDESFEVVCNNLAMKEPGVFGK